MDRLEELGQGESWPLPENLVRRLWKLAKLSEWSEWNEKWRQRCCPMCGGPESYRTHEDTCPILLGIRKLEELYPDVTQPLPLDPIQEIEAKALEALFMGEIQDSVRDEDEPGKQKPFWRE